MHFNKPLHMVKVLGKMCVEMTVGTHVQNKPYAEKKKKIIVWFQIVLNWTISSQFYSSVLKTASYIIITLSGIVEHFAG